MNAAFTKLQQLLREGVPHCSGLRGDLSLTVDSAKRFEYRLKRTPSKKIQSRLQYYTSVNAEHTYAYLSQKIFCQKLSLGNDLLLVTRRSGNVVCKKAAGNSKQCAVAQVAHFLTQPSVNQCVEDTLSFLQMKKALFCSYHIS